MKTITLRISIPSEYKWLAQQPWGQWTVFVAKPSIRTGLVGGHYWKNSTDEYMDVLPESDDRPNADNWRKSLKKI